MNVVLIGMRGAGKTTVARLLAHRLGWPSLDTDEMVMTEAGMSIREIFEQDGESGFRARERVAIARAVRSDKQVIAVGGGAVLAEENRTALRAGGFVVWLTASAETLIRRLAADAISPATRPALTPLEPAEEVRRVLAEREPAYRAACHVAVDAEAASAEQVAERVIREVQAHRDHTVLPIRRPVD